MNTKLPEELKTRFLAGKEKEFFWLQREKPRRIALRYGSSDILPVFTDTLFLSEPALASVVRIGKVVSGRSELGFYVEVPNLKCEIGRNFIIVRTSATPPKIAKPPVCLLKTSRFTVMESSNEGLAVMFDDSGDHQI